MKHDRPVLGEGTREGEGCKKRARAEGEARGAERLRGSTDVGQDVFVWDSLQYQYLVQGMFQL